LRGSLTNTTVEDESDEEVADGEESSEEASTIDTLVYDDYQLYEALNLLKGLSILSKNDS